MLDKAKTTRETIVALIAQCLRGEIPLLPEGHIVSEQSSKTRACLDEMKNGADGSARNKSPFRAPPTFLIKRRMLHGPERQQEPEARPLRVYR
jgi:hypothetical protein